MITPDEPAQWLIKPYDNQGGNSTRLTKNRRKTQSFHGKKEVHKLE